MVFLKGNFRQSPIPSFEEIAAMQPDLIHTGPITRSDIGDQLEALDAFSCDPDCNCPGCLMGYGCYSCACKS